VIIHYQATGTDEPSKHGPRAWVNPDFDFSEAPRVIDLAIHSDINGKVVDIADAEGEIKARIIITWHGHIRARP
jgi:hypothetical protein